MPKSGTPAEPAAELVQTDDSSPMLSDTLLPDSGTWWDEEADEVEGYDLIKEAALFSLVGVPFRAFTLTYRPGIQQKGCEWRNDYVSAETRVAPAVVFARNLPRIMTRRETAATNMPFDVRAFAQPDEQLVVNDGSTGFYRQTVEYLEAKELITVPETDHAGNALPKKGGKNECRYDLPADYWTLNEDAERKGLIDVRFNPQGEKLTIFYLRNPVTGKGGLSCTRGLRFSDYENEYTKEGLTWYIA